MLIFAQSELVTKGAEYGLVGYILGALFFLAFSGIAAWGKWVLLPGLEANRKATEADQANKAELTKAVASLCTVMGDAHTKITEAAGDARACLDQTLMLVLVAKIVLPALRKLASESGVDITDDLSRMEGVLATLDTGSKTHRTLPAGAAK
jgi:hypothetical protein